jgi:hypothetical protein
MVQKVASDEPEQKCLDDIRKYGHHVVLVGDSDEGPGFAYSIGLFETYAHSEIILIGLKFELAHVLINNMAFDIKNGRKYKNGEFHEDVLDGYRCYFGDVPVSKYPDYVGWDLWYYDGPNFPLIQCVYPTVSGQYPWDDDFPAETRWHCPLLSNAPKKQIPKKGQNRMR